MPDLAILFWKKLEKGEAKSIPHFYSLFQKQKQLLYSEEPLKSLFLFSTASRSPPASVSPEKLRAAHPCDWKQADKHVSKLGWASRCIFSFFYINASLATVILRCLHMLRILCNVMNTQLRNMQIPIPVLEYKEVGQTEQVAALSHCLKGLHQTGWWVLQGAETTNRLLPPLPGTTEPHCCCSLNPFLANSAWHIARRQL